MIPLVFVYFCLKNKKERIAKFNRPIPSFTCSDAPVLNTESLEGDLEIPRSISPFFFNTAETGVDEARKHMDMFGIQRQGAKLAPAYNGRDWPFTNKTPDFEGVIDHILYSSGILSVRDVLCDFA